MRSVMPVTGRDQVPQGILGFYPNRYGVLLPKFISFPIWLLNLYVDKKFPHNILPKSSVYPISLRIMPKDAFFVKRFFFWLLGINHMVIEILFFNVRIMLIQEIRKVFCQNIFNGDTFPVNWDNFWQKNRVHWFNVS